MKKLLAVLAFSFSCASQASMTDILTIHSASSQVQINSDINVAIRTSGGIPMESVIDNSFVDGSNDISVALNIDNALKPIRRNFPKNMCPIINVETSLKRCL